MTHNEEQGPKKKKSEPAPVPAVRDPTRGPSYTTVIYAECISESHGDSLVVSSVSVSPYEPRLADSLSFLVVSLTPLALTILSPHSSAGFPKLQLMFGCGSHLFPPVAG